MMRKIIEIDESKCNGCGLCTDACHENAIGIVGGKARLLRDDFCDGLGDCLPACPTGAINFVERDAEEYNAVAVRNHQMTKEVNPCVCKCSSGQISPGAVGIASAETTGMVSGLSNWPLQIRLAPVNAVFFDGANLLIAADCAAYARAGFHTEFMRGKTTLIGCPKLDGVDYTEKLFEIISGNNIKALTLVRMEVPCCGGIEKAAITALKNSGKFIPWQIVTLGTDGGIRET